METNKKNLSQVKAAYGWHWQLNRFEYHRILGSLDLRIFEFKKLMDLMKFLHGNDLLIAEWMSLQL